MALCFRPPCQADGLSCPGGLLTLSVGLGLAQERGNRMRLPALVIERDVETIAHADLPPLGLLERLGEDFDRDFRSTFSRYG